MLSLSTTSCTWTVSSNNASPTLPPKSISYFFLLLAAFSIPSSFCRVHYTPPHTPNHRIYRFFLDLARNPEKVERCLQHAELPWVRLVNGRDIGLLVRKRIGSGRVPLETCPPEKYEELFEDNVKIA